MKLQLLQDGLIDDHSSVFNFGRFLFIVSFCHRCGICLTSLVFPLESRAFPVIVEVHSEPVAYMEKFDGKIIEKSDKTCMWVPANSTMKSR